MSEVEMEGVQHFRTRVPPYMDSRVPPNPIEQVLRRQKNSLHDPKNEVLRANGFNERESVANRQTET